MVDTARLGVEVTQRGVSQTDQALQRLTRTGRTTEQQADNLRNTFQQLNQQGAANASVFSVNARGLGAVGTAAQQAGFQVGDFAVQVASGQNALVAFTQQGAQLAGLFGPGGALIGALLAIGGAIGVGITRASEDAENAIGDLEAIMSELSQATDITTSGVTVLSSELIELANRNREAAEAQIILTRAQAQQVLLRVTQETLALVEATDALSDGYATLFDDVEDAEAQYRRLSAAGLELNQILGNSSPAIANAAGDLTDLITVVDEASEQFDLTAQQAAILTAAFFDLSTDQSVENVRALNNILLDLVQDTNGANAQLVSLSQEINRLVRSGESAEQILELLGQGIDGLTDALSRSNEVARDGAIEDLLQNLATEAALLGATTTERNVYNATLRGANEAQLEAVRVVSQRIEQYEAEQEAIRERTREEEAARREAERLSAQREREIQRQIELEARRVESLANNTETILLNLENENVRRQELTQQQIVTLGEARDEGLISEQQFLEASAALWDRYYTDLDANAARSAQQRQLLEQQVQNISIGAVQTSLSALQTAAGEGNAFAQAAFVANQALAAALVFNQGEIAAASALAPPPIGLGPVAGAALAGSIQARTIASIGAITAQTITDLSRAQGGEFSAGDSILVGERRPEVVTFDQPGTISQSAGASSGASSQPVINQTINVQGNGDQALTNAMQQAAREGAEQGYQRVYQDARTNGSIRRLLR